MKPFLLSMVLVSLLSSTVQARTLFSRPTEMRHCVVNSYIRKAIATARDSGLTEWEMFQLLVEHTGIDADEWDHARKVIQAIYSDPRVSHTRVANDYMTWCTKALGASPQDPDRLFPVGKYRQ